MLTLGHDVFFFSLILEVRDNEDLRLLVEVVPPYRSRTTTDPDFTKEWRKQTSSVVCIIAPNYQTIAERNRTVDRN